MDNQEGCPAGKGDGGDRHSRHARLNIALQQPQQALRLRLGVHTRQARAGNGEALRLLYAVEEIAALRVGEPGDIEAEVAFRLVVAGVGELLLVVEVLPFGHLVVEEPLHVSRSERGGWAVVEDHTPFPSPIDSCSFPVVRIRSAHAIAGLLYARFSLRNALESRKSTFPCVEYNGCTDTMQVAMRASLWQ